MATPEECAFLHNIIFRYEMEEKLRWAERWTESPQCGFKTLPCDRYQTNIFLFPPSRVITGNGVEVYEVGPGYYGGPEAVKDEVRTSLTLHRQQRTKQSSAPAKRASNTDGTSAFITSYKSAGSRKTSNCNPAELQCNNCKYYVIRALIFMFYWRQKLLAAHIRCSF